jgi:hypothetical protein
MSRSDEFDFQNLNRAPTVRPPLLGSNVACTGRQKIWRCLAGHEG